MGRRPLEPKALLEQLPESPPHVADLILVMLRQGLRVAEACSLRVQDVDLDAGTLTVAGQVTRVRGKGLEWRPTVKSDLSHRTLALRKQAREALERRLAAVQKRGGTEYLFVTPRGSTPDPAYYGNMLRDAFDAAGLKGVTGHALRRTVERDLELAGATWSERETFMGHTEDVARKHYADHGAVRAEVIEFMEKVE